MIRRLMASSAIVALMTAGAWTAQAQDQPADANQPAAVQQDATGANQGAAATAEQDRGDRHTFRRIGEVMATGASRYDIARFGAEAMRFSPRQADLLIVAGRVTIKMMPTCALSMTSAMA